MADTFVLTADDRRRIGQRVRLLRVERRQKQRDLAARAGIALGTLQMLEHGGGRAVHPSNIAKVAAALDTTLAALRTPSMHDVAALNREDVEIARGFHTAIVDVKVAVRTLLEAPLSEQQRRIVAQIVQSAAGLPEDAIADLLTIARGQQPPAVHANNKRRRWSTAKTRGGTPPVP